VNAADALNAAVYTLTYIEKIANGEQIGFNDWSEADAEDRLDAIQEKAAEALSELANAGYTDTHNL